MSEEKNFSAFPCAAIGEDGEFIHQTGMKMRDWFAGMALQGTIRIIRWDGDEENQELAVSLAYEIADAMMKERLKK